MFSVQFSPAAKVLSGDEKANGVLWGWRRDLRRRKRAARDILEELVQSGCERKWHTGKQPDRDAITYIDKHQERLNYADAIRENLPIGSGTVEGSRARTRLVSRIGGHLSMPASGWRRSIASEVW